MALVDYSYLTEKILQARSALLAPHPTGETDAFADAFGVCRRVGNELALIEDENAAGWARTILETMDTTGLPPDPRGTHFVRAESLSYEQRREFSSAVDELANWLHRIDIAGNRR